MKTFFLPSLKLTAVTILLFGIAYPLLIVGVAQFTPSKGLGEPVVLDGKIVGYEDIGQRFTDDKYFYSRPSAVNFNAASSGGSNKGPTNPEYLSAVRAQIDSFLSHNPAIPRHEVPSELVTASGSGLDPDISPNGAYVQVARIAKIRNIPEQKIKELVDRHIEKPWLGIFGPSKVNVLKLNIALDQLK